MPADRLPDTRAPESRCAGAPAALDKAKTQEPSAPRALTAHRRTSRRSALGAWLVVAGLAVVPYLNSLPNGFTFDDPQVVRDNPMVTTYPPLALFSSVYNPGALYRPLTMLSYVANQRVDAGPLGYHVVNLVLHVGVSLTVLALGRVLLRPSLAALFAAALFAVHPIHTEAVSGIVGRAELLAALGVLTALLAFVRADRTGGRHRALWTAASLVAFGAALLSKESAFATIALIPIVAWRTHRRRPSARELLAVTLPYAIVGMAYLGVRLLVVGSLGLPTPPPRLDNPLAHVPALQRIGTALVVLFEYLSQLVLPLRLSADYSYNEIPAVTSPLDLRLLVAAAVLGGLAIAVARVARRVPALALAAAFVLLPLALTANLLFPIGTIKAERLLYLPSLGWCLLAGWVAAQALRRRRATVLALVAVVLAACALRTWVRNADWRDDYALFTAAARTSPDSAKVHYNLGLAADRRGDGDTALHELQLALRIDPQCAEAAFAIGAMYEDRGIDAGALHWYAQAMELDWSLVRAHLNTGALRYRHGEYTAAEAAFRSGLAIDPRNPRLLLGLALALRAQRQETEARLLLSDIDRAHIADPRLRDWVEQARLADDRPSWPPATERPVSARSALPPQRVHG